MALNFPDSPALNDIYTDSTSGFSYQWDGTVWKSYSSASTNNIRTLDDISGSFNGVTNSFALSVSGSAVTPANAQQLLISVGGVMQSPNTDYTVSGSNIIFTTAPVNGLTFFGTIIGTAVPVGVSTVGDVYRQQSYAVTGVQTSFNFGAGYTVGFLEVYRNGVRLISGNDFTATDGSTFSLTPPAQNGDDVEAIGYITSSIVLVDGNLTSLLVNNNATVLGITTLGTNVGAGQTALLVQGNARVTGILTVGTGSITINGNTDSITASSGQIKVGTGLTVNNSGVVVGVVTASSINATGTVTASSFSGNASGLTGIVTSVNPVGQTTTSQAGTTTIDLSLGSIIYFDHNTDTTVAFANTATSQELRFVRTKDNTTTARNITWPTNVYWDGGPDAPSLQNEGATGNTQVFTFITRDSGVTWSGFESQKFAGIGTYVYVWGYNNSGQQGQGNIGDSFPLNILGNTTRWTTVSAGTQYSLGIKNDNTLFSWGTNVEGQLGQNNRTQYSSPVQIPGTSWSSISTGSGFSIATKTDGTLWAWGDNQNGQLGQSNRTRYSSPVQIPGTSWDLTTIYSHALATKTDGTLWAWGINIYGHLGQNNRTYYSSPVQIPGTQWSSISAGYHSFATKTDGTLWAWGINNRGQLGQNNVTYYSSPVQIPGTSWSSISSGGQHSLATKTDGTLWAWGYNIDGQLAQINRTQYNSPVQVPGTSWSSISGGIFHSVATKTDGTLWTWGQNQYGELGQSDLTLTRQSSPVQIPGTQWSSISAGGQHSFAFKTIT